MRIRFRTAKSDRLQVELVNLTSGHARPMHEAETDSLFRFYEVYEAVGGQPVKWYFRITGDTGTVLFDQTGITSGKAPAHPFCLIPGFHTPLWAKGAIMYQIFVDRFCRGIKDNDVLDDEYIYIGLPVRHIEDWKENPSTFDVGCFYGGDLEGVRAKLSYLRDLGVEVIYFNPIFVSPSNHKYDTQDYEHVDPHIAVIPKDEGEVLPEGAADNADATKYMFRTADRENLEASDRFFAEFMKDAHRMGFRVILDGVFNHCGSFNKWMDREKFYERSGGYAPGAYLTKDSPYHDYFEFSKDRPEDWPDNKSYDGWWNNETLPKLNYEASPDLVNSILGVARKWLRAPYFVDGWRLDVAADLGHSAEFNHRFWKQFRIAVKTANSDALILAEHYGDPSAWLNGQEWDSIMNYDAFMEPVSWFLTGVEKHSDRTDMSLRGDGKRFWDTMRFNMARIPEPALLTCMNQLSNHDHSRFLTRTNGRAGRLQTAGAAAASEGIRYSVMRQAVVMLMTWPGAPAIYYGDEAGVCGWTDPDSRRTFPWGRENPELQDFHRYVCQIHNNSDALKRGSLIPLRMEKNLVSFGRTLGEQKVLVFIYTGAEACTLDLPVWLLGVKDGAELRRRVLTYEGGYNVGGVSYPVRDGKISIRAAAASAGIFITSA